ncbi:MAG TPA: hypothetical protein VLX85_07110 [Stellaceae bacterium]|nr:hypothetical protein [Stellaceae bacterium]
MVPSARDPLDQICFLRLQATKARRLARSVGDERVVTELMRYADELEARAQGLQAARAPSQETWSGLEY